MGQTIVPTSEDAQHETSLLPSVASYSERLARVADYVSAGFLLLITVGIGAIVFARNLASTPIVWVDDIVRFSQVWLVAISAIALVLRGDHISMDALFARLNTTLQGRIGILHGLVSVAAAAMVARPAIENYLSSAALGQRSWSGLMPATVGHGAIVVGFIGTAIASVVYIARLTLAMRKSFGDRNGARPQ